MLGIAAASDQTQSLKLASANVCLRQELPVGRPEADRQLSDPTPFNMQTACVF